MSKVLPLPHRGGNISVELQEAMARPQLAPHPMYKQVTAERKHSTRITIVYEDAYASLMASLNAPGQIVAGVLIKYVNFGKGWRHRLFVLQNGVLRYYKVRAGETP